MGTDFRQIRLTVNPARLIRGNWQVGALTVASCPLHADRTGSFKSRPTSTGFKWRCYGCGRYGDAIDLVAALDGISVRSAAESLARDGETVRYEPQYTGPVATAAPVISERARNLVMTGRSCDKAHAWLRGRGLCESWMGSCVGAAQIGDDFYIGFRYGSYNKWRNVADKSDMFIAPSKQTPVLFRALATNMSRENAVAVIVEGEPDALAVAQELAADVYSVPNGANSNLTDDLLLPLGKYSTVLVWVDNDKPGRELSRKLLTKLKRNVYDITCSGGCKDAGECLVNKCGTFDTAREYAP